MFPVLGILKNEMNMHTDYRIAKILYSQKAKAQFAVREQRTTWRKILQSPDYSVGLPFMGFKNRQVSLACSKYSGAKCPFYSGTLHVCSKQKEKLSLWSDICQVCSILWKGVLYLCSLTVIWAVGLGGFHIIGFIFSTSCPCVIKCCDPESLSYCLTING